MVSSTLEDSISSRGGDVPVSSQPWRYLYTPVRYFRAIIVFVPSFEADYSVIKNSLCVYIFHGINEIGCLRPQIFSRTPKIQIELLLSPDLMSSNLS